MRYFIVEPEVAGGLGEHTTIDRSMHPPVVFKLHFQLDGWLGDDLLETFPCYIISDRLREQLDKTSFSGFRISEVEFSKSEEFEDHYPNKILPAFYWLKVFGKAGVDDFGVSKDFKLVISEAVLDVLKNFKIDNCDIEENA